MSSPALDGAECGDGEGHDTGWDVTQEFLIFGAY